MIARVGNHRRTVVRTSFSLTLLFALCAALLAPGADAVTLANTTITNTARAEFSIRGNPTIVEDDAVFTTAVFGNPPILIELGPNTVRDDFPGEDVGTLTVTDPDVGDFHVLSTADPRFEIVDGNFLKLAPGSALDFEVAEFVSVPVTAVDRFGLSYTQNVIVQVIQPPNPFDGQVPTPCRADDLRDPATVNASTFSICENVEDAAVAQLPAQPDENVIEISDPRFFLDDADVLRLVPGVTINFEEEPTINLDVTITDGDGLVTTFPYAVTVGDRTEPPSVATEPEFFVPVDEPGIDIGPAVATDPDIGDVLSVVVDDPRFEVVDDVLRLKPGVLLSVGDGPAIPVVITVTDTAGLTATTRTTINVVTGNLPPSAEPVTTAVSADAGAGDVLDQVPSSDPNAGDTLRFEIVAGNEAGAFGIDDSGNVFVADPTAIGEAGDTHALVVRVTDDNSVQDPLGELFTEVPVNITVAGGNPPVAGDQVLPGVREDRRVGLSVGTVAGESDDGPLTFRIVGGNTGDAFAIDPATGEITLANDGDAIDFEQRQSFTLRVAMTDSGDVPLTTVVDVTIPIIDVNERPTVVGATFRTTEAVPSGTSLGFVEVTDPDVIAGDVATLEIVGGDRNGAFSIDPDTGELRILNVNRVQLQPDGTVRLRVRGTDQNRSVSPVGVRQHEADVIVIIDNVNFPPTAIALTNTVIPPDEPGVSVGELTTTDPDPEDTHIYTVDDPRFVVVGSTLRLRPGISLPPGSVVPIQVTTVDPFGQTHTRTFNISTEPALRNPAQITFLRAPVAVTIPTTLVAGAFETTEHNVGQTQCAIGNSMNGPFVDAPTPRALGNTDIPVPGDIDLGSVESYKVGEAMFISVRDIDPNKDPTVRDEVVITLTADGTRDVEILKLVETGPDTAEFVGYIQSTNAPSDPYDCRLRVANEVTIVASYFDAEDGTDTAAAAALVDPFGVFFVSTTGERVDDVVIRLVNDDTGELAQVFGDEPFAPYPNELVSGSGTVDDAGLIYDFPPGGYRFPFIAPGNYRYEIELPNRFTFPSVETDEDIALLPFGPYTIQDGSRGEVFQIVAGPAVRIDIPLDVVELPPSPGEIEFLTYAVGDPTAQNVFVPRTQCVGTSGTVEIELPFDDAGNLINVPATLPLRPVDLYGLEDNFFVRVTDRDEDRDPLVRDTIELTLTIERTGEEETLILEETGLSTGVFVGHVPSAAEDSTAGDCEVDGISDDVVIADYVDDNDPSDVVQSSAVIDPSGVIFDSTSGEPLNGVQITIIDVTTGLPAEVFAGDGVTSHPATVVTGEEIVDGAGNRVQLADGRFRFPILPPGEYRYEIVPVEGHVFPSIADDGALNGLANGPYRLDDGSRGAPFLVEFGQVSVRDVPLDPVAADVFLTKNALSDTVAIGDFLQYEVAIQNAGAGGADVVTLVDTLPLGFRYQGGSARIDGDRVEQVTVGDDGRELSITLPPLSLGGTTRVRYVVEVAAGARQGIAVNRVTAIGPRVRSSNTAEAEVLVREDLMRSKAILVGRVFDGACDTPREERRGLANVRLYLEDGTNVITDAEGRWHLEGIEPGGHVVQLDLATLPESRRVIECEQNTRRAGSNFSQFVDVQGGTLWRADFHVDLKPPVEEDIAMRLQTELDGDRMRVAIEASGEQVPLTGVSIISMLPRGVEYVAGSLTRNGESAEDPVGVGSPALTIRLGDLNGAWSQRLEFDARVLEDIPEGDAEVRAMAMFGTPSETRVRSELLSARLEVAATQGTNAGGAPLRWLDVADAVDRENLEARIAAARDAGATFAIAHSGQAPDWLREVAQRNSVALSEVTTETQEVAGSPVPMQSGGETDPATRVAFVRVSGDEAPVMLSRVRLADASAETRIRAVGEIPGIDEESGFGRREFPSEVPPAYTAEQVGSADDGPEILFPEEGALPRIQSTYFAVKHRLGERVELRRDDELVSAYNYDGVVRFPETGVGVSVWRGIDISHGRNLFTATVHQVDGSVRTLARDVYFSGHSVRGEYVPEASNLVADGITPPEIAIRMFDRTGSPVRPGMTGRFEVLPPYQAYDAQREEVDISLDTQEERTSYVVIEDGLAYIPLEPTTRGGEVTIRVDFGEQGIDEFEARLTPVARDWIIVGFGEGSVAYETLSQNMVSAQDAGHEDGIVVDGRVSLFARGMIEGKWLLTLAYDSDKNDQQRFGGQIDPNRFYSLYGDGSQQQYDAESREKLYLRIEREGFNALFGDYTTATGTTGEFTRYSRRLNGVRTEYIDENWELVAFGAETENAFVRDELRGDGTSGLYRLSGQRIFENSETLVIETRDRFHDDQIVEARALGRHIDYSIDYDAGTILFKEPIPSQDDELNPVFIVVEYETAGAGDGHTDYVFGARAARRFADGDAEVGATYVQDDTSGMESQLAGVDAEWEIDTNTEVRAEAAWTENRNGGAVREGAAWQVEAERRSERVDTRAYYRERQSDFGVGQQSASGSGTRRFGLQMEVTLADELEVDAESYQQRQLDTGAVRNVVEVDGEWRRGSTQASLGGRMVREEDADGREIDTNQAIAELRHAFFDDRLRLSALYERALGGTDSRDFPTRAALGADVDVLGLFTIQATQEFTFADDRDTQDTFIGATANPWDGAALNSGVNRQLTENSERLYANVGLTQSLQLTDAWSIDFGFDREQTLENRVLVPANQTIPDDNDADPNDLDQTLVDPQGFDPARPPASGAPADSDFTSGFIGASYDRETWEATARVELRHADDQDRANFRAGFARQIDSGRIFTVTMDYLIGKTTTEDTVNGDVRLALAWRPQGGSWTFLDRLDLVFNERDGAAIDFSERKLVNNFNANFRPNHRNEVSFLFGAKYVLDEIDDQSYSSFTTLFGIEYRYDLTPRWDIGMHGGSLSSWESGTMDWQFGLSVGHSPMRNVWISLGYNFSGFIDEDFAGAEYMAQGPFLKFRFKVDQESLREYLGISDYALD